MVAYQRDIVTPPTLQLQQVRIARWGWVPAALRLKPYLEVSDFLDQRSPHCG